MADPPQLRCDNCCIDVRETRPFIAQHRFVASEIRPVIANSRAVIWKMLLVAEKRFRRLKATHLMREMYQGAQYVNGVPVNQVTEEKAVRCLFTHFLTGPPALGTMGIVPLPMIVFEGAALPPRSSPDSLPGRRMGSSGRIASALPMNGPGAGYQTEKITFQAR